MTPNHSAISRRTLARDSEETRILRFLVDAERYPSPRSLQLLAFFQPDVHLGLIFYNELYDISFYWDSLTPAQRSIAKHLFLLDYNDATEFPVLDAIYWLRGRSSHVVFPRPSPSGWKLLTLANGEGRLRMSIVPDGENPTHYPHHSYSQSVDRSTISWVESKFGKPVAQMTQSTLGTLALTMYRILMVQAGHGTVVSSGIKGSHVLGEVVVQNAERRFWGSEVHLRHFLSLSPPESFKWSWYDHTLTGIYHGLPGWTRFTLRLKNKRWYMASSDIVLGDDGDDVDNWNVLLSCLQNWSNASTELRKFCLEHGVRGTEIGFVTQLNFSHHVYGGFEPLPGVDAPEIIYLFVEDLRVEADGHVGPCRQYHSLDRAGTTPLSAGLETLYGVHQSASGSVRKTVTFFRNEHFAALDELGTWLGDALRNEALGVVPWRHSRPTLRRSQSTMRLEKVDWRTDWMWEDHRRQQEEFSGRWRRRWNTKRREHQPERALPVQESGKEDKEKLLVRRLARGKTKSVGGGLSLVFSRMAL